MFDYITKKFKNLRIRNQILLVYTIIFALILILGLVTFTIEMIIIDISSIAVSKSLLEKQNGIDLNRAINYINMHIQNNYETHLQFVQHLNSLYKFIQETKNISINQSEYCISQEQKNQGQLQPNQFCSVIYNEIDKNYKNSNYCIQLQQLTSFLDHYIYNFDAFIENRIFFTDTTPNQFTSTYPPVFIEPNFYPHNRTWYINHLEQLSINNTSEHFYSNVYKTAILDVYAITLTQSLLSLNNTFNGVIGININIQHKDLVDLKFNILMMNLDGQIVLNRVPQTLNTSHLNYIYDEAVTGFNLLDWEQIQNFAKYQEAQSNCQYTKTQKCLCRFNTYYQQEVQIAATYLNSTTKFILILVSNVTYDNQLQQESQRLIMNIRQEFYQKIYIQIIVGVFLITLSILLVMKVVLPINQLTRMTKHHINSVANNVNTEIFKMFHNSQIKNNALEILRNKLMNINDIVAKSEKQKSNICKLYEQFTYPIQESIIKNQQHFIFKELPNYGKYSEDQLQFIQNLINQKKTQNIN